MNILTVVFITYVVYASDDCAAGESKLSSEPKGPVKCYECSTVNREYYCEDPFNTTVAGLRVIQCDEACAKWVRKPKSGPTHIIRTCASTLNVKMHWSYVCMKESRPGDGKLCFCDDDLCNSANNLQSQPPFRATLSIILSLVTYFLISTFTCGLNDTPFKWIIPISSIFCALLYLSASIISSCKKLSQFAGYWTSWYSLHMNDIKDTGVG